MLSIGTVSAGNRAQREYHERQLAEARDDYYRESEGPPGTWVGSYAERLGVRGEVTVEQFRRLLDGEHPSSGVPLSSSMGQRKTLAFDLAFSAPKSVSLLRMAADEGTSKAIDRAHEQAVAAALQYIEREGWKGRELQQGRRVTTDGSGVVGVLYRHETTRNADPQLHSHAVLANLVEDGAGRVRAIHSQVLYWQAKTAGTVYQAVLRGELGRTLGVSFDRPVNGLADIEGFDRALIDDFSSRRAEILAALRDAGLSSASKSAAERVALESRRAKDRSLDHNQWRTDVRRALESAGFTRERAATFSQPIDEREVEAPSPVSDRLDLAPLNGIVDRRATEDARPIRQAAMNIAAGFTYDEVGEALAQVFRDDRLVQVDDGDRPRWTTARHLEIEQRLREDALAATGRRDAAQVDDCQAPTRTIAGEALTPEQRRVLSNLFHSGRGLEIVRARAGAGKTTIAGLAREEFERAGYRVVGVAPTLQALAELEDVGLQDRETLARCAMDDGQFSRLMRTMDHRTVVILDEAAMTQTREVAPLLRRACNQGAKVIAIGDDVQLPAVGAGGWFRYLAEHRDIPVLELTEVFRQRDPVECDRLNQLHRGDVTGWIRWADQNGRIAVEPTIERAYDDAVRRFGEALDAVQGGLDEVVVMAPKNAHRHALNARLRRVAAERGIVDRSEEVDLGGLLVSPGDRLVATRTVGDRGIRLVENGERFEVLAVGAAEVVARPIAGARRGADPVRLPAGVLSGDVDRRAVDHAYARTVHKTQGMTVERSILFAPEPADLGRNLAYVGLTRTRERTDLVTVASDRRTGIADLAEGLADRRDHEAAIAFGDRERLTPARLGSMTDAELDEHRHALLAEARQAMLRLAVLDREARGAWLGANDAREDARLGAWQEHLTEKGGRLQQHLATHDPDGDRRRRGLMESTVGRAEARSRRERELVENERSRRPPATPEDDARERQTRAVAERTRVEGYARGLFSSLETVHGQQVDRATPTSDLGAVAEVDRPVAALEAARARADRVADLNLSAASHLGVGHSLVGEWIRSGGGHNRPAADAHEPLEVVVRLQLTDLQRAFLGAVEQWQAVREAWVSAGGRERLDALTRVSERMSARDAEHRAALKAQTAHTDTGPSRLRRDGRRDWLEVAAALERRVTEAEKRAKAVQETLAGAEAEGGRPLGVQISELTEHREAVNEARRTAIEAERRVRAGGAAAIDGRYARSLLGRRDELGPREQRRFDELAGRVAVWDALLRRKAPGTVEWVATAGDVSQAVKNWQLRDAGRVESRTPTGHSVPGRSLTAPAREGLGR